MSVEIRAAKNIASGWLKLFVQLAVGIVIAPFILHKLGDTAFGIWVLIFSLAAHYGLFDFGIRSSIGRFVARFVAIRDGEQLSRFVSTSLVACAVLGLLVLLVTAIGWHYLGTVFKIPPHFLGTARILFVLIGADVALGFPLSVFGCVLEGYQEFWLLNLTHICSSLLRGFLIVLALSLGGGLVMIAAIVVGLNILRHLACACLVFWTTPLRLGFGYFNKAMLGHLASYSAISFTIILAENLRFQSDAIVIGIFLSSASIAFFAVASRLVEYSASVATSLAQIFTPMASHYDAMNDQEGLRRVFVIGNRACALVIFPLCALLIILGKPIIEAWVGAKYLVSYPILLVLLAPKTLLLAQAGSTRILLGLGRQQSFAIAALLDGIANVILSIVLLRHWGILGVALGTAIPLTCTSLFFLPGHLCRLLNFRLRDFLGQAYLIPLGLTMAMAGALVLVKELFHPLGYIGLFEQAALASVVYGVGLICVISAKGGSGAEVHSLFAKFWQHAAGR